MSTVTETLPLTDTITPPDQPAVIEAMREAYAAGTCLYPLGGMTSLDCGAPARRQGLGLSLAGLARVVDYPARDMTITVESGITLEQLSETLGGENQWLPIDAPQPERATLGGVVATAADGPRRYGWGTIRDYVIGISAVDGRGAPFKGGGRVVKNVAGYDFCKLLTGSFGTLGVLTQITLKIRPRPQRSAIVACDLASFDQAAGVLARLVTTATRPSAIELLAGPAWSDDPALGPLAPGACCRLAIGLAGTAAEVDWMVGQLGQEWRDYGIAQPQTVAEPHAAELFGRLRQFPVEGDSPLVLKAAVRPSEVVPLVGQALKIDPSASIQAHAGNGIVVVRFVDFPLTSVSRVLIGQLQPAAARAGGHVVVLSSSLGELTRQAVWGSVGDALPWMTNVKRQFDPKNLLNPGRFIFES